MGQLGRAALKAFFETGDIPTEAEFIDLIDSFLNLTDDVGGAPGDVRYEKITVSSAEVSLLNTVPKQLVPAPGAGLAIITIQAFTQFKFGTFPYAGFTNLQIITSTLTQPQMLVNSVLDAPFNAIKRFSGFVGIGSTIIEAVANQAINVQAIGGDPGVGDGTLEIHYWYSIQDVT